MKQKLKGEDSLRVSDKVLLEFFGQDPFLSDCTHEELEVLSELLQVEHALHGDVLISEGQKRDFESAD